MRPPRLNNDTRTSMNNDTRTPDTVDEIRASTRRLTTLNVNNQAPQAPDNDLTDQAQSHLADQARSPELDESLSSVGDCDDDSHEH